MLVKALFVIPSIIGVLIGLALVALFAAVYIPLVIIGVVSRTVREINAPEARAERAAVRERMRDLNRRIIRHPFSRALWAEAWRDLKQDFATFRREVRERRRLNPPAG